MNRMIKLFGALALVAILAIPATSFATALSADKFLVTKNTGMAKRYLMKASTTMYRGSMCMVNSSGTVEPAAASASNNGVVGFAVKQVTSAASGSYYVTCVEGWAKMAADTIEQEDVGVIVYASDDATIDETASSNEPIAGTLIEYVSASVGWVHFSPIYSAHAAIADPLTLTGDLTLAGGAGALTFTDSASSVVVPDNDATALLLGSTGYLGLITIDTTDDNEEVNIVGKTAVSTFRVDTGFATFDEQAVFTTGASVNGAANALVFPDGDERLLIKDNDADSFAIGINEAAGDFAIFDMTNSAEELNIVGTTATSSFRVDTGFATFDEEAVFTAGLVANGGELKVLGAGATIGWTAADGANTACSTTCAGTGACVMGYDAGTSAFVACNSALADTCMCAGPAS